MRKWILIPLGVFAFAPGVYAQNPHVVVAPLAQRNFVEPAAGDPARELFNGGQSLFDQFRYDAAERQFRLVVERFPKSTIADKAEYYLIRTLAQAGKTQEALSHIRSFRTFYPKSPWNDDVEEVRMQLTNQIPPAARQILIQRQQIVIGPIEMQKIEAQMSVLQEALRIMFRSDVPGAVQIVSDRLKANMADPLVLSSLGMLATTAAPQGLPLLIEIAKNSPNLMARKDAIYWISQGPGDKDATVDTLMVLLPALNEDTSNAVPQVLGQMRTDKAFNSLTSLASDRARSRRLREQALVALGQNRDPRAITALENITTGDPDPRIRTQALQILENLLRRK
jgi:tetratricopeptide (TPR) repeat protein